MTQTEQFDALTRSPEMKAGKSLGSVPMKISPEVGGWFFLIGGHITGRHLELVPGERNVQACGSSIGSRASIPSFQLLNKGAGTKIVFARTRFPEAEQLAFGRKAHYLEGLEKFLT